MAAYDYDSLVSVPAGVLQTFRDELAAAPMRTNLAFNSEQVNLWTLVNAIITADVIAAPDNTVTADQFDEGVAVTVRHYVNPTGVPTEALGEIRTWSIFLKANTLPNITLTEPGAGASGIKFNLGTGVIDGLIGTGVVASGVQTSAAWPAGWYRVWFTRVAQGATGTTLFVSGAPDATYDTTGYTGTSRTFYLWGPQVEASPDFVGPTKYTPTPGAAFASAGFLGSPIAGALMRLADPTAPINNRYLAATRVVRYMADRVKLTALYNAAQAVLSQAIGIP